MKVLKHGNHYRKAVVTCEECGCVFEAEYGECSRDRDSIHSWGECSWYRDTHHVWIDCPECGEAIILDENDFQTELSEKEK